MGDLLLNEASREKNSGLMPSTEKLITKHRRVNSKAVKNEGRGELGKRCYQTREKNVSERWLMSV